MRKIRNSENIRCNNCACTNVF